MNLYNHICFSLLPRLVEVGILGFPCNICRYRPLREWVSCSVVAKGECLLAKSYWSTDKGTWSNISQRIRKSWYLGIDIVIVESCHLMNSLKKSMLKAMVYMYNIDIYPSSLCFLSVKTAWCSMIRLLPTHPF